MAMQNVYELPLFSIREMIANAVCHRSYIQDGKIQVAIYDDRFEVTTPRKLDRDLTLDRMKRGVSKIWNRGIAEVFSYLHLVEAWGSGMPRIYQEAKEYGLREPELIDLDGWVRMNLYRKPFAFDVNGVVRPNGKKEKIKENSVEKMTLLQKMKSTCNRFCRWSIRMEPLRFLRLQSSLDCPMEPSSD